MKHIFLFAVLGLCFQAHAYNDVTTTKAVLTHEAVEGTPAGFVPYLGLGAGYTTFDRQLSTEGTPSTVKILGSYYLENTMAVFDAGLGLANQQFTQSHSLDSAVTTTTFELAARYQWSNRWQAGVVANTFFAKGANYGANQGDAQFAGVQALKEFNLTQNWIARAGGRLMTDLNVNNDTVNMIMLDLQIGLDPNKTKPAVKMETAQAARPVIQPVVIEPALTNLAMNEKTPFLRFNLNKYALGKTEKRHMERAAQVLAFHSDLFTSVEVIGHTDSTGTKSKNWKLSNQRAQQVATILNKKGIKKTAIKTVAKADTDPLVHTKKISAMGPNRRVEIHFVGVKDPNQLEQVLKTIQ